MTIKSLPEINSIHALYCQLTGFALPMDFYRESVWHQWFKAGLTEDDLRLLIRHHQDQAKQGRPARSLVFRNMVVQVDYAQEDLAMIKALGRTAPVTERQRILKASGRPEPEKDTARSAGQVLRESEALKALIELKNSL